ncbi:ATP-dependent DNA helicase PIF1 [Fusarium mundagurra]|uniref:ATP-dependent DNA helicase n=1 Tax=Fusarium mundagurra TaxID=1567541 RepID=A0A8H6DBZ1_9HYPO|nr:ATP-dependent DNA helicase PIF1 [Fusarium mundagurra]
MLLHEHGHKLFALCHWDTNVLSTIASFGQTTAGSGSTNLRRLLPRIRDTSEPAPSGANEPTGRRILSNFMQQTASGIDFFRRGKRSQDTEEEASARAERVFIQRRHRTERRAGQEPSPTPTMSQLLNPQTINPPGSSILGGGADLPAGSAQSGSGSGNRGRDEDDHSFECEACGIRRPTRCRQPGTNICIYCSEPGRRPLDRHEQTCISCLRVFYSHQFLGPDGEERAYCRDCYREYYRDEASSSGYNQSQIGSDRTPFVSSSRSLAIRRRQSLGPASSLPQSQPLQQPEAFPPDPPLVDGELASPCLSDRDQQLISDWQSDLDSQTMEHCPRCRVRWFGINIRNGICRSCRYRDTVPSGRGTRNQRREGEPYFWTHENNLDPGDIPEHLPELTQVEEMLISRVHVHVQVMTYRGQQYKYKGHVINFLKDIGQVYRQLLLLPQHLDVIILRPQNQTAQPHMIRQFRGQFRVRQAHIRQWLEFLRANHPGYRDIVVDEEHLSQLPVDGDVTDQLITELIDPAEIEEFIQDDLEDIPGDLNHWETAAVPNFIAQERDLTYLRSRLQGQQPEPDVPLQPAPCHEPQLEMPNIRSTPLNEFNRSQALLSLAFPTLFPTGQGDFVEPRQRGIQYGDYIERLMKFHDGRFARHPRFPYVAFNTLMRQQVNQRSSFFIKKDGRRTEVDIAQLRTAFDSDTPEAKSLLNSIIRYSGSLRGTRPFWGGRRHQLEAYVHGLGCPGIFLTFSAADLHWESLQRHMPRYEEWQNADNHSKVAIARKNLKENPHIAAHHFHMRFTSFLKHVIKPKFNVTESWFRYEWQARGSTHSHGLFWIKDAPTLNQDPGVQLESINEEFLRFWGAHITAINPNRQQPGQQRDINPLITISPNPTFRDLAALASIDTSPCTSQAAVINYVVKYVGKAEKKSESYKGIAKSVLPRVNSARGVVGFVAKFMNRLIAERDWSAQEIQHLLLNLDLTQGTRVVITVDCRHPRDHWRADFIASEGEQAIRPTKDVYQKYLDRPQRLQDSSYFHFLTKVDYCKQPQQWRVFPTASDRILNYFPRYDQYNEDFARVKLMLHHPHSRFEELLTIEYTTFETYLEAYQHCRLVHQNAHPHDYYSSPQLILEEEFEEDPDDEDEVPEPSWEALGAGLPQDEPHVEEVPMLGNRPIDLTYDWSDNIGKFPQLCIQKREYWKSLRDNYSQQPESSVGDDAVASLNPEQRLVFDLFVNHLDQTLNPNYRPNPRPLLVQVDGQGGTGKSYLIHVLSSALNSRQRDCVVRAAPTGIAANAINGSTLHSLLHLPLSKQITTLSDLTGNELTSLQATLSGIRYIILMRSQCCRLYLRSLYATGMLGSEMEIAGQNAYRAFEQSVELKQVVRQQGDDQAAFRDALQGLRSRRPTAEHWRLLSSRVQSKLTEDEIATFDNAVRIYPTNAQVRDFNRDHMERLDNAVISVEATHSNAFGHDADSTVAGNLHKTLPICIGARVMLTENLWAAVGLVSGAVGIVEDIAWEDRPGGVNPRRRAPEVIAVRFEGYTGPPYFDDPTDHEMAKIIPIFRSNREYVVSNNLCSRKQFPLTISYAITVHKSQGTTLDKAVADISGNDFTAGLSYVAVSPVKTLAGIMFETAFDLSDISARTDPQGGPKEIDRLRRLPQMLYAS